jgi:hypothetical protein
MRNCIAAIRVRRLNERGSLRRVALAEQRRRRAFRPCHSCGVGDEEASIRERQAQRFDERMQVLGGSPRSRRAAKRRLELLQDIQCDERGDALAVRRRLVHIDSMVAHRNRVRELRPMTCHIASRHARAFRVEQLDDALRGPPLVEARAPLCAEVLQHARERKVAKDLARPRRAVRTLSVREHHFAEMRPASQLRLAFRPLHRGERRDRKAFFCELNGGAQHVGERHTPAAPPLERFAPPGRRAWHCYCVGVQIWK